MRRALHRLDRILGIERDPRGEAFWLIPAAVLAATVLAFLLIGTITAAPLYVSLPNGAIIAMVMAGLTVACMTPSAGDGGHDDHPRGHDDDPVLGSPGGPWQVIAHLGPSSQLGGDDLAPADASQREPVAAARP